MEVFQYLYTHKIMADIKRIGVGNSKYPPIDQEIIEPSTDPFTFDSMTVTFDEETRTFDENPIV